MKKKPVDIFAKLRPILKPHETGLDTLLVSEVSAVEIEEHSADEPDSLPVGTVVFYDRKAEPAPRKAEFVLRHEILTEATLRKVMADEAKSALNDETAPAHVHSLANRILGLLPKVDSARSLAALHERLSLWKCEQPAAAGKRIRAAAMKKGRTAPAGSLRDFFNSKLKDWRNISAARLLIAAKKEFPKRSQANLARQILRLKKGGQ